MRTASVSDHITKPVRVRFAPNGEIPFPGFIVRTVLYSWLFARHFEGIFVLRLDDTDVDRQTEGALQSYPDGLRWLGLEWDEGPEVGGTYGPYSQSQRLPLYTEAIDHLVSSGAAYPCFCSPERLAHLAQAARKPGARQRAYDGRCRSPTRADIDACHQEGRSPAIRFRVPDSGSIRSRDLLRGDVVVHSGQLSDFVICRPDGWATYHLTVVVDDTAMRISHVIRGIEGLANMAPQALVYDALGYSRPDYLHHPLVRTRGFGMGERALPDGELLYLKELQAREFPREAILSYYARLGYGAERMAEFPSLDDMVADFDYTRISKKDFIEQSIIQLQRSAQRFLRSLRGQDRVLGTATSVLRGAGLDEPSAKLIADRALPVLQGRIRGLEEISELLQFVVHPGPLCEVDEEDEKWTAAFLEGLRAGASPREIVDRLAGPDRGTRRRVIRALLARLGASGSPLSLAECVSILGPSAAIERLDGRGAQARR